MNSYLTPGLFLLLAAAASGAEPAATDKPEHNAVTTNAYYTVDLRDERIRIPSTVKPLFDQFMRDTYCMLGPDGWYYLTGTPPAPGRITMSGDVCDPKQRIAWTPELHYIKSKKTWLINACMGSKLDPRRGAFILRSTSGKPEGPYENIEASRNGPINNLPGNFSADNSLFEDDDGSVYFVGVDHYVMKMKDDLSGFAEPPHTLIETPWKDQYYCEGGYIFKHGGKYHLVQTFWSRKLERDRLEYSESKTLKRRDDPTTYGYDAVISTSDNIYGPYGPRYTSVVGGGHLKPFQDAQGRWWGAAFGNPNGQASEVNAFDGKTPHHCVPLLVPLQWEKDRLYVDHSPR